MCEKPCDLRLKHSEQIAILTTNQMQYREDFLSMKDDFEELKHQVDDVQKAQLEQGKDVHYIKRSIDELNVKLDKKAPLPTGIAAGIIISVSAAIILMIINILIER